MKWTMTKSKFLTQAEIENLIALIGAERIKSPTNHTVARDYFIIRLLLETGLRVFELCNLSVDDLREGSLTVKRGKCGKSRTVLLTKSTVLLLSEYLDFKKNTLRESLDGVAPLFLSEKGTRYSTRGIRYRVKFWLSRVGLSQFSVHSLRHSYASLFLSKTKDLTLTRDQLGHASIAITSIYVHANRDLGELELFVA